MNKKAWLMVGAAGLLLCGGAAFGIGRAAVFADEPANTKCPLMNKPVTSTNIQVDFQGKKIALCCTRCKRKWDGLSDDERAAAVAKVLPASLVENAAGESEPAAERIGDAYPLEFCPITGEKLGSMGDPVVKIYEGREVRFCCDHCIGTFEKDMAASFKRLDAQIIEIQAPLYAMDTCPVSDNKLGEGGKKPVDFVYGNRLVRLCCAGCKDGFLKDPKAGLAKVDEATKAAQDKDYPLTTCLTCGGDLKGDKVTSFVCGGRLVKVCCNECIADFEKDPAKHLQRLEAAWEKSAK